MANPSSVGVDDYAPAIFTVDGTPSSVTLDPSKRYRVWHMGVKANGDADTSNLILSQSATVEYDDGAAADKLKLEDVAGFPATIGPGWETLHFRLADDRPVRLQATTFQAVPCQSNFGRY